MSGTKSSAFAMGGRAFVAAAFLLAAGWYLPATAQIGNAGQGKVFIDQQCTSCHITGAAAEGEGIEPGPEFVSLADYPKDDLVNLLAVRHSIMPYIPTTMEQVDDIIAHLRTLKE